MIAGQALSFTPDYLNAKVAAARLFKILATESKIDATQETGTKKVCLFLHFFGQEKNFARIFLRSNFWKSSKTGFCQFFFCKLS